MTAHAVSVDVDSTPRHFMSDGTEAAWSWSCACGAQGIAHHVYRDGAVQDAADHLRWSE